MIITFYDASLIVSLLYNTNNILIDSHSTGREALIHPWPESSISTGRDHREPE